MELVGADGKAKVEKVFVGILAGDNRVNVSLAYLLFRLPFLSADKAHRYEFFPWICSGTSPQEYARNIIIQHALDRGADRLVMIDNDMIYHGSKTLLALLDTDADIAGTLQLMWRPDAEKAGRGPHIYPCAMMLDPDEPVGKQARVVWPVHGVDVTEVDAVGSGFTAIRMSVFKDKRMLLEAGPKPGAFYRNVYRANGERIRGLDVDLCKRAKDLGYSVAINWKATCGHLKDVDLYEMETYVKNQFMEGFQHGQKGEPDEVQVDQGEGRAAAR